MYTRRVSPTAGPQDLDRPGERKGCGGCTWKLQPLRDGRDWRDWRDWRGSWTRRMCCVLRGHGVSHPPDQLDCWSSWNVQEQQRMRSGKDLLVCPGPLGSRSHPKIQNLNPIKSWAWKNYHWAFLAAINHCCALTAIEQRLTNIKQIIHHLTAIKHINVEHSPTLTNIKQTLTAIQQT